MMGRWRLSRVVKVGEGRGKNKKQVNKAFDVARRNRGGMVGKIRDRVCLWQSLTPAKYQAIMI